jgi:hypothetical protein
MTQGTVLESEVLEFLHKGFVLASLASPVLLGYNTLATRDARREEGAAFGAMRVADVTL